MLLLGPPKQIISSQEPPLTSTVIHINLKLTLAEGLFFFLGSGGLFPRFGGGPDPEKLQRVYLFEEAGFQNAAKLAEGSPVQKRRVSLG